MKQWLLLLAPCLLVISPMISQSEAIKMAGVNDKIYMGMALGRCYDIPSGYGNPVAFIQFGVEFKVREVKREWYQVDAIPGQADSSCYVHRTSMMDKNTFALLLAGTGKTPEQFAASLSSDDSASMGTSNFSEKSSTSFAAKGFSERSGVSFAAKGFSEKSSISFAAKGFSEKTSVSFATKGFSERSATSFAAKGFSERSGVSFAAKGFSEKSSTSFATKGFSEKSSTSFASKGFSEKDEKAPGKDAAPSKPKPSPDTLIESILNSEDLSFINPNEQLRDFRQTGRLGEYKWGKE